MKRTMLAVMVLILAACSAAAPSEYEQNLKKWEEAQISHYRYQLFIGCFCPFVEDMPLTIEVKNGDVVSIARADGTFVNPADAPYESYTVYATIDRVFLELEAALAGEADEVIVAYDPLYGFPASIAIDRIKEAIDDELSVQVSGFEVLE